MTPSNAARLSALEARQQVRDAVDEAQNSLLTALALHAQHANLDGVKHAFGAFLRARGVTVAPPSPLAAEGEAGTIQLPPAGAYFYDDDPPTPGPAPATITRVRELLAEHVRWSGPGTRSGNMAAEALRLLDAERETAPSPETIALPWLHPALEGWSIVGMNHYHVSGERRLFIAMTHGGACVKVEGPDAPLLWNELRQATAAALARLLDAEPRETGAVSAWEEAEIVEAMALAMACDACVTMEGDARAALRALAPHLAARDAAAFRRGADAQRALMHHLNRHIQRLDEFPLATPETEIPAEPAP